MQLPASEELILLSGFSPIKAKKVRYYADKNFTGRVSSPPMLFSDGYGGLSPTANCVWGIETRSVDDRLYSEAEKTEQDKIASALNSAADADAGGKDHSPELEPIEKEVAKNEPEKTPDVSDENGFATSLKLGEFVRGVSPLARAHDLTRSTEIDLGM